MINTVRDAVAWKYTMRNATVSCNKDLCRNYSYIMLV